MIVVPKKNFSKATERNKIKRQMRECFRINKHILHSVLEENNLHIALLISYIAKDKLTLKEAENSLVKSLNRLHSELKKMDTSSVHNNDKSI